MEDHFTNHYYKGDLEMLDENTDEDDYIKKIEIHLSEGGDIDDVIRGNEQDGSGRILFNAVLIGRGKIVKYSLNKGAAMSKTIILNDFDYTIEDVPREFHYREWNILEMAILNYSYAIESDQRISVYEIMKEESLQRFSFYGLHPIHLECAIGNWSNVERLILSDPTIINKTIDEKSPLWAGVTPLLIAAKFSHQELVTKLLDTGASPRARDSKGNTPLHFLPTFVFSPNFDYLPIRFTKKFDFYERRLFIFGDEDTFGGLTGTSHFHIACQFCPDTINVVKAYLDQGVSPNLPARENDNYGYSCMSKGENGLHVAGEFGYPDLALLLLQYGADVHLKIDDNETAWDYGTSHIFTSKNEEDLKRYADLICLLLEVGASSNNLIQSYKSRKFIEGISKSLSATLCFVRCVKRILELRKSSVSSIVLTCYQSLLRKVTRHFDEIAYGEFCKRELSSLAQSGLYSQLFDDSDVSLEFNLKFESLIDSPEIYRLYPLYGNLLNIRLKRQRIEYDKKKKRLAEALPIIIRLFLGIGHLPITCAEEILWNLNYEELGDFIKIFYKNLL